MKRTILVGFDASRLYGESVVIQADIRQRPKVLGVARREHFAVPRCWGVT